MRAATSQAKPNYGHCPGEIVPVSGVYAVQHNDHRSEHIAILLCGEAFPACRTCKDAVRFTLSRDVAHVAQDRDFLKTS